MVLEIGKYHTIILENGNVGNIYSRSTNISNIGNINADIIWSTSYWKPKNPI